MGIQPSLWGRTFRTFFASPGLYLAVAIPLFILMAVLLNVVVAVFIAPHSSAEGHPAAIWKAMSGASKAGFMFSFIFSIWVPTFLAACGITFIAAGQYGNRVVTAGQTAAAIIRFVPAALIFSLVPGMLISMASTFLILPGFLVAAAFSLLIAAKTVEGKGPFASIGRSLSLASSGGAFLRALGLLLTCSVLVVAGEIAGYIIAPFLPMVPRPVTIMACLAIPWTQAIIILNINLTLLYFDATNKSVPAAVAAVAFSSSTPPPPKPQLPSPPQG